MLNRKHTAFQKFVSVFFAGMYLFVTLFSSQLHNHKGEFLYKDSSFKKTEKSIYKELSKSEYSDCLACHFLATGSSLVPEEFVFYFENHTNQSKQIFSVQEKIWSATKYTFQLRGPPSIS